jgi:hypothetical protein
MGIYQSIHGSIRAKNLFILIYQSKLHAIYACKNKITWDLIHFAYFLDFSLMKA